MEAEETRNDQQKPKSNHSHSEEVPILEHWGLDPLFWAHVKLFIGQVLGLPSLPGFSGPEHPPSTSFSPSQVPPHTFPPRPLPHSPKSLSICTDTLWRGCR